MHMKQHTLPSEVNAEDLDNPRRMLKELMRDSQERRAEKSHAGSNNSKRTDISKSVVTTSQYGAVGDDPKEMLQELNRRYWAAKALSSHDETSHLTGSKAMLTDIKKERQALGLDAYQDTESNLETVFERSTTTHSPFRLLAPQHTMSASGSMLASSAATSTICRHSGPPMTDALDRETIPYAVALMLESAGCKWEEVMGWTLFLFSSGMDEYRVRQERKQKAQEKETFDAMMARLLAREEKRRAVEKTPFANRVILSDLAADVDPKSIHQFFSKYQKDIRDITLLPDRDPVKRTRTAYVDMSSRTAAVCASFEFGYIYGLKVQSKLAVEE
ncbi:uncharacterized protein yc1106_07033 [Curvularia clavata]|uniref:RRM domain-containing protein n=1 Tax=Curvularia clavata TaxID=95742 RepID=A0A9Q8ZE13_CURCL|nr:uncharacterized protein yc1106_07033 [Curvularia clavata]